MYTAQHIQSVLRKSITKSPDAVAKFFKTEPGQYAAHDQFIGVPVPVLRKFAREFKTLSMAECHFLICSTINEERLLALFILIDQYQNGTQREQEIIYQFYINHLQHINNWNLVDASAHLIMGAYLFPSDKKEILIQLAKSDVMWKRRISVVATWYFIRNNQFEWTVKIAKILLSDTHDLIHKSVGWMLRETGKRDVGVLIKFLDQYASQMPRTMLRYAIEKFSPTERKKYLLKRN